MTGNDCASRDIPKTIMQEKHEAVQENIYACDDVICNELAGNQERLKRELKINAALNRLKRELKINAALASLSKAIISPDITSEEMYQMVLDQARALTESQHGIVSSIDPLNGAHMSNTLTIMEMEGCSISSELYVVPEEPHRNYGTLWGHSLNIRIAFFTNNPVSHPAARGLPVGHIPLKNFLAVPIIFKGELLGQIALANSRRDYMEADLEVVGRLGELYAVVLHNRRREEVLFESEEQFRQMFNKQQVAMYLVEPDTLNIIDANEAAQRFYGYNREEFKKLRATDLNMLSEDEAKKLIYNISQNQGRSREIKHRLKNGNIRDMEAWFTQINLKTKQFFFTIVHDITERKRMEEAMRLSEEKFFNIFHISPDAIAITRQDGTHVEVNDGFTQHTGFSKEEVLGKMSLELGLWVDSQDRERMVEELRCHGEVLNMEAWFRRKDGSIGDGLMSARKITVDGENCILTFTRDITDLKMAEEELAKSRDFLDKIINSAADPIFVKDLLHRWVLVNDALCNFVGKNRDELLGKSDYDFFPQTEADVFWEKDELVFTTGIENVNEEEISDAQGLRHTIVTKKTLYTDEKGGKFLVGIISDITERKQMEEELRNWKQQTRQELELAAQVQRETLPKPFTGDKLRVDTIFLPYHTVSGDFFNYKWFEEQQKLCGYIIDVSGHGVSTALQTAMVKILLDNILLSGREIGENDFWLINQRMMRHLSEEAFAGLQYFEFDLQASVLKVISAGIQFFLAAKPDECALVPVFSSYLGMFDTIGVQTLTMPLKAGEVYCMMSDGVSDLVETHGTSKQAGLAELMVWLGNLALNPDRSDDFSAVCIEIL